jgi:hypothetical protein
VVLPTLAAVATSGRYEDLTNKPVGLATETYVNTQISNLIDTAPTALNTLNELAAALGDDPNFATTLTTQLGLKVNSADLATVATSGSYNDLTSKPTLFSGSYTYALFASIVLQRKRLDGLRGQGGPTPQSRNHQPSPHKTF